MLEISEHPVSEQIRAHAHLDAGDYRRLYQESISDPDGFWDRQAREFLSWDAPWTRVHESDMQRGHVRWFIGARLNVSHNCIDRHLPQRAQQTAIIWEGDGPGDSAHISYAELHGHVCRLANALKGRGVGKGDRVCIYMPMIPEAAYAMLACARIGAVHSVVFGGFSPESLKDRILDCDCRVLITADEGVRGDTTAESLGKLPPAFAKDGTITAGSASQISDGAAAVVVMSKAKAEELGLAWLAEIGAAGWVAGPDSSLQSQPAVAVRKACAKEGITPADLDLLELNEAFAAVGLASTKELGVDPDKVNVNGGAIAMGHPVGMSGARIVLHLALELKRRGGGVGAAALCGGGGQGDALIIRVPKA